MRYTTILDLRDWSLLYKNKNIRLLWLHLTLSAAHEGPSKGYYFCTIRQLAEEVGITPGECRHALAQLNKASLIAYYAWKGRYGHRRSAIYVCKDVKTFKEKTKRNDS